MVFAGASRKVLLVVGIMKNLQVVGTLIGVLLVTILFISAGAEIKEISRSIGNCAVGMGTTERQQEEITYRAGAAKRAAADQAFRAEKLAEEKAKQEVQSQWIVELTR
jgi:hypothetical protein